MHMMPIANRTNSPPHGRHVTFAAESNSDEEFDYLTLTEAAGLIPGRNAGRKLSVDTIWRWCLRGVGGGIRLKSVMIGGRRFTKRQWLEEFIAARSVLSEAESNLTPMLRTTNQRAAAAKRASEQLRAIWSNLDRPV